MEAITSIEFIEEPLSLVTVSKDLYLRVWNEKLELIGELNIFFNENHKFLKPKLCPWNFRVNETAILEREINEIVETIEYVGIKPIKFGSEEDVQNSKLKNVQVEESKKIVKKVEKKEKEKEKKKSENENEDNKMPKFEFTTQYETLYLKNLMSDIEYLLQNNYEKTGFREISNNLIDSIIYQKEMEKDKEKININKYATINPEKKVSNLTSTLKNNITKERTLTKTNSQIIYPESELKSDNLNIEKMQKKKTNTKIFKNKYGSTFTPDKSGDLILNLYKNETSSKEYSKLNSINNSEISAKINNNINIEDNTNKRTIAISNTLRNKIIKQNKFSKATNKKIFNMHKTSNYFSNPLSKREKYLKRNLSSGYIQINGFENVSKINKRPKTGKEKHMFALNQIPNNIDRNTLYSSKLFLNSSNLLSQTKSKFFPSIREKLAEANKNNILNYNMREKTEDLVKNQFYLNSYKNCCKIIPNNSLSTNSSIMLNYKNMWNNVKSYTNSIITKKSERVKKIILNRKNRQGNLFCLLWEDTECKTSFQPFSPFPCADIRHLAYRKVFFRRQVQV